MKISNKDHKLLSLHNTNDSFNVPYYQRNYSWDKKIFYPHICDKINATK